jgi:flagellar export protein FliJ
MSFRFTLDVVLRFRESVERTEEATLHRIVGQIAGVALELQKLSTQQIQLREQRERDLTQKLPAAHLIGVAEQESELNRLAEGLSSRLQQLEMQRLKQLAIYQTACQDRQVLSELRDQQRRAHGLEQRRQEQKMLDDLFLARWKDGD